MAKDDNTINPGKVFDDLKEMMSKFGEGEETNLKQIEVTLSNNLKEIIYGTESYIDVKGNLVILNNQTKNDTFVAQDTDSWITKRTAAPGVDIVAIYTHDYWKSMRHV